MESTFRQTESWVKFSQVLEQSHPEGIPPEVLAAFETLQAETMANQHELSICRKADEIAARHERKERERICELFAVIFKLWRTDEKGCILISAGLLKHIFQGIRPMSQLECLRLAAAQEIEINEALKNGSTPLTEFTTTQPAWAVN